MIIRSDARAIPLLDDTIDCIVTSPPYWGLRDYGMAGQIGLEQSPADYVARMVEVFREVRRVLKPAGTLWLNLGDSYAGGGNYRGIKSEDMLTDKQRSNRGPRGLSQALGAAGKDFGLEAKQLVGIPWRVAFAVQADGWWLRSDIVWAKPNPMPESVQDRPTRSHEYVFLLAKSERYWYDADAISEPRTCGDHPRNGVSDHLTQASGQPKQSGITRVRREGNKQDHGGRTYAGFNGRWAERPTERRNARTVWSIPTQPYSGAHFATFPEELARRCIRAGCPAGGVVLDPFAGSGTVGKLAIEEGREAVLCDLAYQDLAKVRTMNVARPLPL